MPALLARATHALIDDRRLIREEKGWHLQPDALTASLPLKLRARKTPFLGVPNFPTAFVGRVAELQAVKHHLESGSLVSLIGPGGVGKTRLAVQAATEVGEQFADGLCFVPLAPVALVADLARAICNQLGAIPTGRESAEAALLAFLREKDMLLILDNLEHLRDGLGLLATLREQAPSVTLLITSREPLYLPGEVTVTLGGLPFAREERDVPVSTAALQLFARHAQGTQPAFVFDEDDRRAAARICCLVEGLPLAIELAAAWARSLGCQAVAAAIEQNVDFLREDPATTGSSRSARAVLDYFWSTLSASEQAVLQSLAVFRGGFTREIAQPVAGASPFFLDALVQKAFLTVQARGRFQMHELLRQYAGRQLAVHPAAEQAAHARHADCYLGLAEAAEPGLRGADQRAWLDRLELELGNFRAALDWGLATDAARGGARRLAAALAPFWLVRGYLDEGRRWLALGLAVTVYPTLEAGDARARVLVAAATLAIGQSDYGPALAYLDEAATLWRGHDHAVGQAEIARLRGLIASNQGNLDLARTHLEAALAFQTPSGERLVHPLAVLHLGKVVNMQGDHSLARSLYTEYFTIASQAGDLNGMADAHNSLAAVASDLGEYDEAMPHFEEALALARHLGNKYSTAKILLNLGTVARNQGQYGRSADLMAEGLALFQELGDARGIAVSSLQLGKLAYLQGHPIQATAHYAQALGLAQRASNVEVIIFVLPRLATIATSMGQFARAASLYGAEAALRAGLGVPLPPADQAEHDEDVAAARAGLGEDGWQAAWATGSGWSLDQTIAFALEAG